MTLAERKKIIDRIVKLSAITPERGATQAESDAAKNRGQALIDKHGITRQEFMVAMQNARQSEQPTPPPAGTQPMPFQPGQTIIINLGGFGYGTGANNIYYGSAFPY